MNILRELIADLFSNHTSLPEALANFLVSASMGVIWIILGIIISLLLKFFIKRLQKRRKKELANREKTIIALILSIIKIVLWFFILVLVIDEFGVNIMPILASAGIIMFAVGFGAQEMIKDFLAGFFLIFEQAFNVGDIVEIGGFRGTVIDIGLRRTKLRNFRNEVQIINNGDIRLITNFSLDVSIGMVEVVVPKRFAYETFETPEFKSLLAKYEGNENILAIPEIIGITSDDMFTYVLRLTFKAKNSTHIPIERILREDVLTFIREKRSSKEF
ncbi:MAG: mechanosensitive ion channel family protein [Erysipelotrichales bacterium]|nr:mechanosensitive ion channel family protein [Erysipelotrichales bacterium]